MYLNCGCGEYQKRHKPTDITMDDLANLQEAGRAIQLADHAREDGSPV